MYTIVIFCLIFSLATAKPLNQQVYKLPLEKLRIAQEHAVPCAKQHNVDSGIFQKVIDGTLPHDEPSKNFLYCFGLSTKLTAEDGHINVDKMSQLMGDHPLLEEFKKSLRDCNKITKENALETLMEMNSCINNNAPVIFGI